ncbi:uncharacterized protein LOC115889434 [Sitophilus oryzae]|uniref:Uncharacterized protein LOC115889434 n=1 Tax=Sitophilus oryzae TaxID=7048 RepID=A0A6J2YPL5_SITOR|nr:uncharacterized protein LOC115889434 [Sitophilus oryzae]
MLYVGLTDVQRGRIITLTEQGMPQRDVAVIVGYTQSVVSKTYARSIFIDGNLTGDAYVEMLNNLIEPAIVNEVENQRDLEGNLTLNEDIIHFQQDGAPPQYSIVTESGGWIDIIQGNGLDEAMIRNGNLDLDIIQMPQEIPSLFQNVDLPFVDCDSSQCSNPSPHGVGASVVRRRQSPVMTVPSTSTSMPKGIPGDLHPYKYKTHQNADLFQDCQKLLDKFNYPWELMPLMYTILKDAKGDLDEASRRIDEETKITQDRRAIPARRPSSLPICLLNSTF